MEAVEENWSEAVEDLIDSGDTDKAISLLESLISKLNNTNSTATDLKLSSALIDLADLYSSKGFSLKADELHSRSSIIKQRAQQHIRGSDDRISMSKDASSCNDLNTTDDLNDDWEAIADRGEDELISSQCLPGVSKLSLEDVKAQGYKRRGRGTFSYGKQELYSDHTSDKYVINNPEDELTSDDFKQSTELHHTRYGTQHVLLLSGFSPSTRTTELEKLFEDFQDQGFYIKWVNDTVALAVFRTPKIALEACKSIQCSFTVRLLDEGDIIMGSMSKRDLEPSRKRPETSARTAKRLIAQGMGIKLPSTAFGSKELRKQEEARKNRIVARQNLKDDAWGDDDAK